MANINRLKTRTLSELALSNTFLYLMNVATKVESRVSLLELVGGSAINTGSGSTIFSGLVNNALNFKSIKSVSTVLTLDSTSTELSFNLNFTNLDLSLCKNTVSLFLSTVNLATNVGATVLPVANGGTGVATLTDGGILLGSGTGAVTAMSALAAGSIIQGDGTTDPSVLALGTAGQILTVNGAANALEYTASPTAAFVSLATDTLDMANNNIDLGTGWISKSGIGAFGLKFDTSNKAHLVPDGATATGGSQALNIAGNIFLKGDVGRSLVMGSSASGNGSDFTISSGLPGTSSSNGGALALKPGYTTSGTGGNLNLFAGYSTSGSAGDVVLLTCSGSSTTFPILRVDSTKKVSIQNSTSNKTPLGLLDVQQTEAAGGIPVLSLKQDDQDFAFAQFTGTAAAASTTNISTSTATAAAKTGAIKVKIQNGADSATDAWIRVWASAV